MNTKSLAVAALTFGSLGVLAAACSAGEAASPGSPGGGGTDAAAPAPASNGLPCDVDAVLAANCRQCHTSPPQFGAPMPLTSHDALHAPLPSDGSRKVYERVVERIASDQSPMPPPPNARLSDADRATLTSWVAAGAPSSTEVCGTGPAPKPAPTVACTPNVFLRPASKWTMPKDKKDEYVCYGFDIDSPSPTHVTAFEPRVDNTKIVHHIVLFEAPSSVSPTPQPCGSGGSLQWRMVSGWAPGGKGMELPKDVGFPLVAGGKTHYVMQIHYSNLQALEGEVDESGYDLCTEAPRAQEADVVAFGTQSFTIPATGQPFTRDCQINVPAQLAGKKMIAAMPHMHKLGTAMSTVIERAGAAPIDLGTVAAWDFNTQAWLAIDGETKSGDVIRTKCTWVNGTGQPVGFGDATSEEMCYSFTMYYPRVSSQIWSWALPAVASTCK